MKLFEFERTTNAFNFVFEKNLEANEVIIVKMPPVSANKRGINDIGWISSAELDELGVPKIKLYGTLAKNPKQDGILWQEIRENDEINKCASAIKIVNGDKPCRIEMRAIYN